MVITWLGEERAGLCASRALVVHVVVVVVVVEEVDVMKRRERRRRACSRGSIRIFIPVIIKNLLEFCTSCMQNCVSVSSNFALIMTRIIKKTIPCRSL